MKNSLIILLGLVTCLLRASAAQPETVEAVAIFLAPPVPGEVMITPSGNRHVYGVTAIQALVSENPLLTGLLTWEGDFQTDAEWNGVGSGRGEILVGTWSGATFTPTAGKWLTKFEVHGNMSGGPYEGKLVATGVGGAVDGLRLNLMISGGGGVDAYTGLLIDSNAEE